MSGVVGFDLNGLDQYTEKEGTRLQKLKTMSIVRSGLVIKLAIEKEGQLPLLTTFDQVYTELSTGNLPLCYDFHASLDLVSSPTISLIHSLCDSSCHLFKAMPLI